MRLMNSYKKALIGYVVVVAMLFSGFSSFVVAPHRQGLEMGVEAAPASDLLPLENRKFSDYSNAYIPEITEHLTAARSGWLALWTKNTELGRPLYQISGFGSAYPPSWIIAKLVDQPWRFLTSLSLTFCFMAGLFVLLFARERGLAPVAGLVAATSLATSPLFMYWLACGAGRPGRCGRSPGWPDARTSWAGARWPSAATAC